ncbi:MAG: hypothetical protein QM648_01740 [Solirubrobacterales bacterium]
MRSERTSPTAQRLQKLRGLAGAILLFDLLISAAGIYVVLDFSRGMDAFENDGIERSLSPGMAFVLVACFALVAAGALATFMVIRNGRQSEESGDWRQTMAICYLFARWAVALVVSVAAFGDGIEFWSGLTVVLLVAGGLFLSASLSAARRGLETNRP